MTRALPVGTSSGMRYPLLLLSLPFISLAFAFGMTACTDSDRASWSAYGKGGTITCYSGGKVILEAKSSGRIATVEHSDGWEFKDDDTGEFVRVSGDCVIRN